MAPVATNTTVDDVTSKIADLKTAAATTREVPKTFNPFYSPEIVDDAGDADYKYADYKPTFPKVDWEPLPEVKVHDRALDVQDKSKPNLIGAATKVKHLTPIIGTQLDGIDLSKLTDIQKDELALLVAERGVVFFRDQSLTIEEQLELGRYWGPLHKHATTPLPKQAGLEEVHVVYNDKSRRPNTESFSKLQLWHSDVTYEQQPPGPTSFKLLTSPEVGGDTIWSSGYALYSGLSPGFQKYLEGLEAVHTAADQANGSRAAGLHVRRKEIDSIHPVVRVNPATGWKSVYVNPGFTRRILGVPKAESDAILEFLFRQISENQDYQVRYSWEVNSVAVWDNRVLTHSAIFDFWPATRHALRVTPHAERPLSVKAYETQYGKEAKDRQLEIWKQQGIDANGVPAGNPTAPARYND